MRIEERCSCGAQIVLVPNQWEGGIRSNDRTAVAEREAWKQIDRWRKFHAGCRSAVQATSTVPSLWPGAHGGTATPLPKLPTTTCRRGDAQGPG